MRPPRPPLFARLCFSRRLRLPTAFLASILLSLAAIADTPAPPDAPPPDYREIAVAHALETYGWGPLAIAVLDRDANRVRALIADGADVDVLDKKGRTLAEVARLHGLFEMQQLLVDLGAPAALPLPFDWRLRDAVTSGTPLQLQTALRPCAGDRTLEEFLASEEIRALMPLAVEYGQLEFAEQIAAAGYPFDMRKEEDLTIFKQTLESGWIEQARSWFADLDQDLENPRSLPSWKEERRLDEPWRIAYSKAVYALFATGDPDVIESVGKCLLGRNARYPMYGTSDYDYRPPRSEKYPQLPTLIYRLDDPSLRLRLLTICRDAGMSPAVFLYYAAAMEQDLDATRQVLALWEQNLTQEEKGRALASVLRANPENTEIAHYIYDLTPMSALLEQGPEKYSPVLIRLLSGERHPLADRLLEDLTSDSLVEGIGSKIDRIAEDVSEAIRKKHPEAWKILDGKRETGYRESGRLNDNTTITLLIGITEAEIPTWSDATISPEHCYIESDTWETTHTYSSYGAIIKGRRMHRQDYLRFPGREDRAPLLKPHEGTAREPSLQGIQWIHPGRYLYAEYSLLYDGSGHGRGQCACIFSVKDGTVKNVAELSQTLFWRYGPNDHVGGGKMTFSYDVEKDCIVVSKNSRAWERESIDEDFKSVRNRASLEYYQEKGDTLALVASGRNKPGALLIDLAEEEGISMREIRRLNPDAPTFYGDGPIITTDKPSHR